jgi:hypothetical protein
MDTSEILLAAAAALLINGLFLYYVVRVLLKRTNKAPSMQ